MVDSDSPIEVLVEGLTREWRHQNRLVIYRLTGFNATIMNAYLDACRLMIEDSFPHRPEYGIHHFDTTGLIIDSSLYNRLMKLADLLNRQNHRAVAAVILPNTWVFRSLITLAEIFAKRSGNVTLCYFVEFDMAVRWIEGVMQRDSSESG